MTETEVPTKDVPVDVVAESTPRAERRRARDGDPTGAAVAASRHRRALALPGAALPAHLAGRLRPLQADVDRRDVGDSPAVPDDGGVHARVREVRELPVEGDPVSDLHVLRASSLDVLRVIGRAVEQQSRLEPLARDQGLLPANPAAARGRDGSDRGLPARLRRARRDDGVVHDLAEPRARARAALPAHGRA